MHLLGQLTGRHEDQAARGAAAVLHVRADAGQQRQAEGEGLARAGGGLAEHVAAGEGVRQRGGLDGERVADAAPLEGGHQLLGQAQLTERRACRLRRGLAGGAFRGGDDVVRLERDRVNHSHAGWGSDTARSASREKGGRRGTGVLAGDRCAQSERGICTDTLMPRRSVREDDRPMCRYSQASSQDRRGIPAGRVAILTPAVRRTPAGRRRRAAGPAPRRTRTPAARARSVTVCTSSHDHPNVAGDGGELARDRHPAHQPVVGVQRDREAQPVQPVDRVGGQRRVRAGLHVRRRRDLEGHLLVAHPPGQRAERAVVGDLVGDPHAVPEPLRAGAVQGGADALDAVGLARVDGAVGRGAVEQVDGRGDAVGREPDLRAGQVEADHAGVAVADDEARDLLPAVGLAHRAQQRADR